MTICILRPYQLQRNVVAHKFIKGAHPGLKRQAQVTSDSATNAEKKDVAR